MHGDRSLRGRFGLNPLALPLGLAHALVLGAVARVLCLVLLPDQGFPDAAAYHTAGVELFTTGMIRTEHHYMPLYPIWSYLTGGGLGQKLADVALSVATIALIWKLAMAIFGDRLTALLAALAAAVWPHFVFYSVSGLTETGYTFLLLLGLLWLYQRRYIAAMVVLALSILVRPAIEMILPLLVFAFAVLVHREGWRAGLKRAVQAVAIYLAVMAPWWVHQYVKYDTFVRLNLADGVVLYAGNNPVNRTGGAVGYGPGDGPGISDIDASHPAYQIADPMEQSRALKAAAIDFIRNNPGRFVELAGLKLIRLWQPWPFAPAYQTLPVIAVSLLSYGTIMVAVLAFAVLYGRRWAVRLSPVLLVIAWLTAVHMITIASIRYRFPLEPFLIVMGSYAIARLVERQTWMTRLHAAR